MLTYGHVHSQLLFLGTIPWKPKNEAGAQNLSVYVIPRRRHPTTAFQFTINSRDSLEQLQMLKVAFCAPSNSLLTLFLLTLLDSSFPGNPLWT